MMEVCVMGIQQDVFVSHYSKLSDLNGAVRVNLQPLRTRLSTDGRYLETCSSIHVVQQEHVMQLQHYTQGSKIGSIQEIRCSF